MNPDMIAILKAIAGAAGAPGDAPPGANPYSNPYGWSPLTDRSMGPLMQQSQTTAMMGAFAPLILQMVAPQIASRLQSTSNLNPGLASNAQHLSSLQQAFTKVQNVQQTAAISRVGQGLGMSKEATENLSQMLPIVSMFAPEVGNMLSRFDPSGAGFGMDGAMMSAVKAGGLSARRVDARSAESMARLYAQSKQRAGKAGTMAEGMQLLDTSKTAGMTVSEMTQMRAGLVSRGIVDDAFAGINDVDTLRGAMSEENRGKTAGAKSLNDIRDKIGSVELAATRDTVMGNTMKGSEEVEKKYAQSVRMMGSVFTSMQGDTEGLLRMIEKLDGPLSKLDPEKLTKTMAKFMTVLDKSGMAAKELAKGMEVFSARTGNTDKNFAMHAVGRAGAARSSLMRAGVSDEASMGLSSEAADLLGAEAMQQIAGAMGDVMTDKGKERLKEAVAILKDPSASPEAVDAARRFMLDPRNEKGVIKTGMEALADSTVLRSKTGSISADALAAGEARTAKELGMSPEDWAQTRVTAAAGGMEADLARTVELVTTGDAAAGFKEAQKQLGVELGRDVSEEDVRSHIQDSLVAQAKGSDKNTALALARRRGYVGKEAATYADSLLNTGSATWKQRTAAGAIGDETIRRVRAGSVSLIEPDARNGRSQEQIEAELRKSAGNAGVETAGTAVAAIMEATKKDGSFDASEAVVTAFKGLGVVGDKQTLTDEQVAAIKKSSWARDYAVAAKEADEKVRSSKIFAITADMAQASHFGSPDEAEQFLKNPDAFLKATAERGGGSKTGEQGASETSKPGGGVVEVKSSLDVTITAAGDLKENIAIAKGNAKTVQGNQALKDIMKRSEGGKK